MARTRTFAPWCTDCLRSPRGSKRCARALPGIIGLTGIQYTILISVSHLERRGEVSVSMIAEHLHISGAFRHHRMREAAEAGPIDQAAGPQRPPPRLPERHHERRPNYCSSSRRCKAHVNDVLFGFLDEERFREFRRMVDRMTTCGDQAVALLKFLSREGL